MTPLGKALRAKYRTPQEAVRALGLDEALLRTEQQMSTKKPTRLAAGLLLRTASAVNPLLAMDARIDYLPIFKDLTTKNFKAADVMTKLRQAVKGKLIAKDEEMGHVGSMLKKVEEAAPAEASLDESVSPEQHKAMEAAAHGQSNLGIPKKVGQEFADADKGKSFDAGPEGNLGNFLRGKGMGEDDIKTACDMIFKKEVDPKAPDLTPGEKTGATAQDESEEEKKEREEKEAEDARRRGADDRRGKGADDKRADDKRGADDHGADDRRRGADDKMVTKDEMNAAIKAVKDQERAVRSAIVAVKPWIGDVPATMAFDTATEVLRHAAKRLGVKGADKMHPDALMPVIEAQPRLGARQPQPIAQDADVGGDDALKSFKEMYGANGARFLASIED